MKKPDKRSGGVSMLTANQLQEVYEQNPEGLLRVINRHPELANSIRRLLHEAEVAVTQTVTSSSGSSSEVCSPSTRRVGVFSRVGPATQTPSEGVSFCRVGAGKTDHSASACDDESRNRSVSVPTESGLMSAETIFTKPGLMSAETIFTNILRDFWWPKKYESTKCGQVKILDFPTYESYTAHNLGLEYRYLSISGDAKLAFSELYKEPIELLKKVHEFLKNDANALAAISDYINSEPVNDERRLVLSEFSAQLSSVDELDYDPRLKMLEYLSLELFLKQKIRFLIACKNKKTRIKKAVNRTPLKEEEKVRLLAEQLRIINTRISETLGEVAILEQRVIQLGLIDKQGDHVQSISPLYDLIEELMRFSELSKRSNSAPPAPGAMFAMDM